MKRAQNRKNGELEAITILEKMGIKVDADYFDDNSCKSMPDIRCENGHYIEVTHTYHNFQAQPKVSRSDKLKPGEDWSNYTKRLLNEEIKSSQALDRIRNGAYKKDPAGNLTQAGQSDFKKDAKLLKKHLGYDVTEMKLSKQYSEFKCDHPTIHFSTDNILREIVEDKGKKYTNGSVDLFIFATDEEFQLMRELIPQFNWNETARSFLNQILKSPFPVIYVCAWCLELQKYNTDNPEIVVFSKTGNTLNIAQYWQFI